MTEGGAERRITRRRTFCFEVFKCNLQRKRVISVCTYSRRENVQQVLVLCCLPSRSHTPSCRIMAPTCWAQKKNKKKRSLQATAEKNCTRHAQLMITSSTLAASQQSLLNSLSGQRGNAQKMKWINASRRQKAEAGGTKPLVVHLFPHLSPPALTFHLLKSSRWNQSQKKKKQSRQHK